MSVSIFDIDYIGRHEVRGEHFRIFGKEIYNACVLGVEVGSTKHIDGNGGSRVHLGFKDLGVQWDVEVSKNEHGKVDGVSIDFTGGEEHDAVIEALEFMLNVLKEAYNDHGERE